MNVYVLVWICKEQVRVFLLQPQIHINIVSSVWGQYGSRNLPPGGILQEWYLRGCKLCCRLSDSPCFLFPVPFVSHLQKRRAAAYLLKTTSSTTYITLLHPTLLHSHQNQNFKWPYHTRSRSPHLERGPHMSPGRTAPLLKTSGVLTLLLILLLLISATFVALDLICNLWNTLSLALNLIFSF